MFDMKGEVTDLKVAWERMTDHEKTLWHIHNDAGMNLMGSGNSGKFKYHVSMTLIFQGDFVRAHETLKFGCSLLQDSNCCHSLKFLGDFEQTKEELTPKVEEIKLIMISNYKNQ